MKLLRAEIKNYRSIQGFDIEFDPKCRTLVGINESGKTNILHALNLLDPATTASKRDLREPGLHEKEITDAYVRFIFALSDTERKEVVEAARTNLLSESLSSIIITIDGNDFSLEQFCSSREGILEQTEAL